MPNCRDVFLLQVHVKAVWGWVSTVHLFRYVVGRKGIKSHNPAGGFLSRFQWQEALECLELDCRLCV